MAVLAALSLAACSKNAESDRARGMHWDPGRNSWEPNGVKPIAPWTQGPAPTPTPDETAAAPAESPDVAPAESPESSVGAANTNGSDSVPTQYVNNVQDSGLAFSCKANRHSGRLTIVYTIANRTNSVLSDLSISTWFFNKSTDEWSPVSTIGLSLFRVPNGEVRSQQVTFPDNGIYDAEVRCEADPPVHFLPQ